MLVQDFVSPDAFCMQEAPVLLIYDGLDTEMIASAMKIEGVDGMILAALDAADVNLMGPGSKKDDHECKPEDELMSRGVLDIQAMTFMRGRSVTNTYIILDEAQNCTPQQIFTIVTRLGEGSKVCVLGDPDQIDNANLDKYSNGLTFLSEMMRGSPLCWQVTFHDDECVRSPLANEAIRRLGRF